MARRFLTVIATLGTIFNIASVLSAEEIKGNGMYRPFSLIRQVKLATAFFVDPDLINKAKISNAYTWDKAASLLGKEQLLEQVKSGKIRLSVPVAAAKFDEQRTLTLLPISCPSGSSSEESECQSSLDASVVPHKLYVLSTEDLDPNTEDRVVSWNPAEKVQLPSKDRLGAGGRQSSIPRVGDGPTGPGRTP